MKMFLEKPVDFQSTLDVVGIHVQCAGKFLLIFRDASRVSPNTWCVPGGKREGDETLAQAAVRELQEETGIQTSVENLRYLRPIYRINPNLQFTFHMFAVQLATIPEVRLNVGEHTDFVWTTPAEALKLDLIPFEDDCIKMIYNV